MDGWNTAFLLGRPIFRGYVSFKEGVVSQKNHPKEFLQGDPWWVSQGTNRTASFTPPNLTKIKAVKGWDENARWPGFPYGFFFSGIAPPKKVQSHIAFREYHPKKQTFNVLERFPTCQGTAVSEKNRPKDYSMPEIRNKPKRFSSKIGK